LTDAYNKAAHGNGFMDEFVYGAEEKEWIDKYADLTGDLHTDLHECLGHGSGQLLPGIDQDALKAYGSTIEEARADLFGLYFMADPMMQKLGLLTNPDAYKAQYYSYFMNGLSAASMNLLKKIKSPIWMLALFVWLSLFWPLTCLQRSSRPSKSISEHARSLALR
jgi:hypothetical protein